MKEGIRTAFDGIRADHALLERTAACLEKERARRGGTRMAPRLRAMGAAAALLMITVGLLGYYLYFSAAAYISIDVNPSMELTVNRMNRVIGSYAFNEDGQRILGGVDLRGKKLEEAAALLVEAMDGEGYIRQDALVSLTVQGPGGKAEQALCDALLRAVNEQVRATAVVEVFPVSAVVRESAHACHMSPAKYTAIQELLTVDETATLEQYSDSGIPQIRQRTQQCREAHGAAQSGVGQGFGNQGQGQGQGHGHGNRHGHGYRGGKR